MSSSSWLPATNVSLAAPSSPTALSSAQARPARPGRPQLARLNTSEMIKTQHAAMTLEASPVASASRRSPSNLKLSLDTAVPRRASTISALPHASTSLLAYRVASQHLQAAAPSAPGTAQVIPNACRTQAHISACTSMRDGGAAPSSSRKGTACPVSDSDQSLAQAAAIDGSFEVSTILPDFLYLGPTIRDEHDLKHLKQKGVRRILNVASEVDEIGSLRTPEQFDGYLKLPMLDSVEAVGVQDSILQACAFLDEAQKCSEPVYVHCKAGKSRSVTIVIAYLIHSLRWTLRRAYSHVAERRNAVSPNIGFVAELMRFEQKELQLERSSGITDPFEKISHEDVRAQPL
ncbi:phosphatases II [Testicularia cyperi]|uniref:protein-tyrosine-phosphatase n=1 Tax=Testicularia cyperi TaxID=1882483 RepID=A0A317XTF9_9BASI|nr:phosphatases II [Testicularia cyperi]